MYNRPQRATAATNGARIHPFDGGVAGASYVRTTRLVPSRNDSTAEQSAGSTGVPGFAPGLPPLAGAVARVSAVADGFVRLATSMGRSTLSDEASDLVAAASAALVSWACTRDVKSADTTMETLRSIHPSRRG